MQCAVEAIAEVGLPRSSLAETARRAGISKAAILYHFASRDDLISQVLATAYTDRAAFLADRVGPIGGPANELCSYLGAYVDYVLTHRAQMTAAARIALNLIDEEHRALTHDLAAYNAGAAQLREILRRGQLDAQFGEFDVQIMATTIQAAIDALAAIRGLPPPTTTLRKWVLQAQTDAGARPGPSSEELAEIKRLKKENADLREANEISKAALIFFARELHPRHR